MSQGDKSALYRELKGAGVNFDRPYREYTTDELAAAVAKLRQRPGYQPPAIAEPTFAEKMQAQMNDFLKEGAPRQAESPREALAAERAYQDDGEKPIRTDEQGRVWYREEVLKPAFPKPRARRKLSYLETGAVTRTVANGRFTETFEEAGNESRTGEVRITMPSYQVGVYKDPKFPFKIHTYNGNRGFDLFDVQKFYGGGDLVPVEIKRLYVENDLCYDIRTTIRAIQAEYRQQQMKGSIR